MNNTVKTGAAIGSYLQDTWSNGAGKTAVINPVTLETVATVGGRGLDLEAAVAYARDHGRRSLAALSFAQRAALLRTMADTLQAHRDQFALQARLNSGNTEGDVMFDIDGGIAVLKYYASVGKRLGDGKRFAEADTQPLDKDGHWVARHVLSSVPGIAVHINAFNFPSWGLWEKVAPALLAGVPCIAKPATAAAWVSEQMVRALSDADVLPSGSLSLLCGPARDLLDQLDAGDTVAFTGSAETAATLRSHPAVLHRGVRFNAEADSLNAAVLGPDVTPESDTYALFRREIVREMTTKAGQKCTAIRRILVPAKHLDAIGADLVQALSKTAVGDPATEGVRMGPLQSPAQRQAATEGLSGLRAECEVLCGGDTPEKLHGADVKPDCFLAPTLLRCTDPDRASLVHEQEVFGPVATLMPYADLAQAGGLLARGKGSLVSSLYSDDTQVFSALLDSSAGWHGRLLCVDSKLGKAHGGHGVVMPQCVHGGPGRAGGGQELGGLRGLLPYLQRTAIQGQAKRVAELTEHDAVWPGV